MPCQRGLKDGRAKVQQVECNLNRHGVLYPRKNARGGQLSMCKICFLFAFKVCPGHSQPLHLIGTILALKCSWCYKLSGHMLRFVYVSLCA
eukprot:1150954-Pelagomonas_calceolata.AAC.1